MFDNILDALSPWLEPVDLDSLESETIKPLEQGAAYTEPSERPFKIADGDTQLWNDDNFFSELQSYEGWGDPLEDGAFWEQQQGPTSCAVVSQASVYESITGIELSEADACRIAQENGWFDPESGTSPQAMGKLLNHLGIETFSTYDADLEHIATALEQGDKVIVALDAHEIWQPLRDPATGQLVEQADAGHAVWITGMHQAEDGSVQIVLNDSGVPDGRMKTVDAQDFLNAWGDYGNFLTVADAPSPSSILA